MRFFSVAARPPALVITCTCGARGKVGTVAQWVCGACGRSWEATSFRSPEYTAFLRRLHGVKRKSFLGLGAVAAVFIPLTLLVNHAFLMAGLVLLAAWYFWYGPVHRKQVRGLYAAIPHWKATSSAAPETGLAPQSVDERFTGS